MKKWLEIEPLIDNCFYSFFANGPLGVAILDQDHHFVRANDRVCDFLGYGNEELQTLTLDRLLTSKGSAKNLFM